MTKVRGLAMEFPTHIPTSRPVGISDEESLSCRIEHGIKDATYGYWAYPDSLFGRPTGRDTLRVGILRSGLGPVRRRRLPTVTQRSMYSAAAYQLRDGYCRSIYPNPTIASTQCVLQDMDLSYPLYPISPKRRIFYGEDTYHRSTNRAFGVGNIYPPTGRNSI